jgi:hypothetical protein
VSRPRLPVVAFTVLVAATVGAFFVTQHLKATTPLLAGAPAPHPAVINPISGRVCGPLTAPVDHRRTFVTFYLLHRADDVSVAVVDPAGTPIKTFRRHHMAIRVRNPPALYSWDGRENDGSIAPDGTYYYRITLLGQGRSIELTAKPITVRTRPPAPVVRSVSPSLVSPPGTPVTIRYTGTDRLGGTIGLYRTDLPGTPRVVKQFRIRRRGDSATWDGLIAQRPAPAGTYLVGLEVTDDACNIGRFPQTLPPAPGSTSHAGVTVRYLAVEPPMTPVQAGTPATVFIDSRRKPYRWALRAAGNRHRVIARGHGTGVTLQVRLPAIPSAGVYELAVRSGLARTVVPLVASTRAGAPRARVLVVLPSLSWQGTNPVDDDGDGVPNTLTGGGPISLQRPLVLGLPAGFTDEAALVDYLLHQHRRFDVTTDLALVANAAAQLRGRTGVVLAGSEMWLPTATSDALRAFVQAGGHVLSLGHDSLRRGVTVQGSTALDPTGPAPTDAFGARPGTPVTGNRDLLTVISDGLHIFTGTSGAFSGVRTFQPITPAASELVSVAGTSTSTPGIIGFALGHGAVVDVGVAGFASALPHNADFQEFLARVWSLLGG